MCHVTWARLVKSEILRTSVYNVYGSQNEFVKHVTSVTIHSAHLQSWAKSPSTQNTEFAVVARIQVKCLPRVQVEDLYKLANDWLQLLGHFHSFAGVILILKTIIKCKMCHLKDIQNTLTASLSKPTILLKSNINYHSFNPKKKWIPVTEIILKAAGEWNGLSLAISRKKIHSFYYIAKLVYCTYHGLSEALL